MQRLLNGSGWDAAGVRDDLRGRRRGVPGVSGCAAGTGRGGVCEEGRPLGRSATPVHRDGRQAGELPSRGVPGYTAPGGVALVDRELYLPKSWTQDRVRCRAAGIADEVEF